MPLVQIRCLQSVQALHAIKRRDAIISRSPRVWMWASVIVQIVGLANDALWHGVLRPAFEAQTFGEMLRHLTTVHLPLYVGVVGLLISTAWALLDQAKHARVGIALPLALAGAIVQTAGEAWHAYSHLQLRANPIPEMIGFVGLVVAISALLFSRRGVPRTT